MDRRQFLCRSATAMLTTVGPVLAGCRTHQVGRVMTDDQRDTVGSHAAGAETFRPLVQQSVGRLLARPMQVQQVGGSNQVVARRICFAGLENRSSEELGDFRDQLVATIENCISEAPTCQLISRRFVESGLRTLHRRPDELFVPQVQRDFLRVMEQMGKPFDFLLFANLTSGTTRNNSNSQRDYLLTLELVNIRTGEQFRDSAEVRKSYTQTRGLLR